MDNLFEASKYIAHKNIQVRTPYGYQLVEYVHKTKPLPTYEIRTTNRTIIVAYRHTFVVFGKNVVAENLRIGDILQTPDGYEIITSIKAAGVRTLYDISLSQQHIRNETYFSNGILSHNSGKTITTSAYLLWLCCFKEHINIGIVANRGKAAREMLHKIKQMFVKLPIWLTPGVHEWNKGTVIFDNSVKVGIDVPTADAFKGETLHVLVVDECAFIKSRSWHEFADSAFPTQSALAWKKNILISTPNGLNHFYEMVKHGENDYNSAVVRVDWREVPRFDAKGNRLTPDEFKASIIERHGLQYFLQNYACEFIGSAETIISQDVLDRIYTHKTPIRTIQESDSGGNPIKLRIYSEPEYGRNYFIGVDTSKNFGDDIAIIVLDVTDDFEVVAAGNFKCWYTDLPTHLQSWSLLYNNALLIVENNEGSGQSVADKLAELGCNIYYDNGRAYPGARTTQTTRNLALATLRTLAANSQIKLTDETLLYQLQRFSKNKNGKFEAADGHDDLVMALVLCINREIPADTAKIDTIDDFPVCTFVM